MLFELQRLGHIVFTESTSQNSKIKEGTLFVPDNRSDKQNRSFESFRKQLEKEDYHLYVFTKLKRDKDGCIVGVKKICKASDIQYLTTPDVER